jgi:outer membrane protein assembly factor BamB
VNTRWIALALLSAAAVLLGQTSSSSWPQYLGPKRNGAVDLDITGAKLTEAWRRPLPSGTAGIAAEGGRLYTLGTDGSNDLLFALDAATGKELWRATIAATHVSAMENGPASTPAVAAGLIVAVGSSCGVAAFKVADGSIAWQHNLADPYNSRFAARGGCGLSPLIADKFVILTTGAAAGARLVAFDLASGKEIWNASTLPSSLNAGPGFAEAAGVRQVLYHHAKPPGVSGISVVRADDGTTMWQFDLPQGISDTIPLALADNRVLLQTWADSTLIDGSATPRALWTSAELSALGPPPVYRDGHIYGFGGNSGEFLKCVDAKTAQVRWLSRVYRGSLLLVGSTLVMLSESSGLLRLIPASPAAFEERARLQVLKPGARTFTPPSFAEGRILLRNLEEIVAVDVK